MNCDALEIFTPLCALIRDTTFSPPLQRYNVVQAYLFIEETGEYIVDFNECVTTGTAIVLGAFNINLIMGAMAEVHYVLH